MGFFLLLVAVLPFVTGKDGTFIKVENQSASFLEARPAFVQKFIHKKSSIFTSYKNENWN